MKTQSITKARTAPKSPAARAAPRQAAARAGTKTRQTFASVFDALADTPQEAANLRARAQLARQITNAIGQRGWTQDVAAQHCGVTQPRINDLLNGRLSRFSLDALVNIASAIGEVNVELRDMEPA
jgi:predicted XRE-type DNA-binding protein